jgi:ABC-2 type transport system permease protein
MMFFTRTSAIVLRFLYLLRGSPARWLPLFVWVSIDILLWGFITKYLNSVVPSKLDFVPQLLGAVIFFDFFVRVLHGVSGVFFEDVWSRNFLNIFGSPLSISEYLSGLVLTSVGTSMVGLIVMLVLAISVFGLSFAMYGVMVLPFLLILFLFGIALGIVGCGIVLRLGPASEWFIWPIPAMVSPFAGVFYPLSTLPSWMQFVSNLLPPSYVFEEMRKIVVGQPVSVTSLAIGIALALLYIALACFFFARVFRYAVRTGLIARYSAESVS